MRLSSGIGNGLPHLISLLAEDGARAAEAELALSRAELATIIRRYMLGIAAGIASVGALMLTLALLAQASAIAMIPYVGNAALAYLIVAIVLAVITVSLILIAKNYLMKKHEPIGLIFKWFADITQS